MPPLFLFEASLQHSAVSTQRRIQRKPLDPVEALARGCKLPLLAEMRLRPTAQAQSYSES